MGGRLSDDKWKRAKCGNKRSGKGMHAGSCLLSGLGPRNGQTARPDLNLDPDSTDSSLGPDSMFRSPPVRPDPMFHSTPPSPPLLLFEPDLASCSTTGRH